LRTDEAQDQGGDHDPQDRLLEAAEDHLAPGMAVGDADDHRGNDQSHGAEGEHVRRHGADPAGGARRRQGVDQQLGDDGQVAEVHDADVEPGARLERMPEGEAAEEQGGEQEFEAVRQPGGKQRGEDEHGGERLDRRVERRPAQDVDGEGARMNWLRVRSSMTRKATRNRPRVMLQPSVEMLGLQEQRLGDPEQGQDDQEETVVAAVAVRVAVADQRGEQQDDDAWTGKGCCSAGTAGRGHPPPKLMPRRSKSQAAASNISVVP
jgi:hypothetical protein